MTCVHTVVIEQDGHSARRKKNGYAIAKNQRIRVVHFEPLTAMKFQSEHLKWRHRGQCRENTVKMVGGHDNTLPSFQSCLYFPVACDGDTSSPPTIGTTQTFTSVSISWARWILTV